MRAFKHAAYSTLTFVLVLSILYYTFPRAGTAYAAVSVDSTASSGPQTTTPFSYTHTLNSLSDTMLVISLDGLGAQSRTFTSVTVNGITAVPVASTTLIRSATGSGTNFVDNIWDFVPTTTVNLITVTTNGTGFANSAIASSTALNGVNADTLDGVSTNQIKAALHSETAITTTQSGDYFVDSFRTDSSITTITPGASQVGNVSPTLSLGQSFATYKAATTTGLQTMYYTWPSTNATSTEVAAAYAPSASRTVNTSQFTYCRTITSNNDGFSDGIATTTPGSFPLLATSTLSTLAATSSGGHVQVLDPLFQTPLDVVFVDEATCSFGASSTAIPHFFEHYATTTGAFVVHLGTSNIASTTAKKLAMYYGNAAFTSNLNSPGKTYTNTSPLAPVAVYTLGLPGFATTTYPDFLDSTYYGAHLSSQAMNSANILNGVGTTTTGYLDGAVDFRGAGTAYNAATKVTTAVDNIFKTGGTVCFWTKVNSFGHGTSFGRWFDKSNNDAIGSGWFMDSADNGAGNTDIDFTADWGTTAGEWETPGGTILINNWYHICETYNSNSTANNPTAYINGASQVMTRDSIPAGTAPNDTTFVLDVGNRTLANRGLDGIMDDVRLYASALTTADVLTLYNNEVNSARFWTFGAETTQGGAPVTPTSPPVLKVKATSFIVRGVKLKIGR